MNEVCARGVVGAFRRRHALDRAVAEARRDPWRASFPACRPRTRRCTAPPPGRMPRIEPRTVPRRIGRRGILQVLPGRHQAGDLAAARRRALSLPASRLRMISAKPNRPIATVAKPMPSDSSAMPKVMRDCAGLDVGADHRQQQAEHDHRDRLQHRALGEHHGEDQAEHHQREIFGRARTASASLVSGAPSAAISTVATQPAKNEPIAAIASAGPARPCLRHLVAVERGHHRGRLARNVDQDRGGRAAILRAVIDAGEHDQRADRRQAEGDRQQHGDRRDRCRCPAARRPACRPAHQSGTAGC